MLGFVLKLALGQMATRVVGNAWSGAPIFSGFFGSSQPQTIPSTRPATKQDLIRFLYWAFGSNLDLEAELDDAELIEIWNSRWGNLEWMTEDKDFQSNLNKMWDLWVKLEN